MALARGWKRWKSGSLSRPHAFRLNRASTCDARLFVRGRLDDVDAHEFARGRLVRVAQVAPRTRVAAFGSPRRDRERGGDAPITTQQTDPEVETKSAPRGAEHEE